MGACLSSLALAQGQPAPSPTPPAASVQTLAPTVVTATRIESRADEVLSDVMVVDRAAIESATARTLPELLAREAGLQFSANGGAGQGTSVYIRGTNGRHAVLLVDGVRVGSATAGTPVWENIPLEAIERIEILKGPASALYGADAAGGVVQVFTRPPREGFHRQASLSWGSYGHGRAAASLQGGSSQWRYSLSAQQLVERGFSATDSNNSFNYHPDADGIRQTSLTGGLRLALSRDWQVDTRFLYSDGVARFDDGAGRDARSTLQASVLQGTVKGRLRAGWLTEASVSHSEDINAPIVAAYPDAVKTTQQQWSWQSTWDTWAGALVAGVEQRFQVVDSDTDYTVKRRRIDAGFVGLMGQQGVSSWQFNARHDTNSQFGGSNTGLATYGLQLGAQWRASAAWGTTFVAPSFNDLYYPGSSNPTLRPEHGVNREVALAWAAGGRQARLTYFENRIRDLIVWSGSAPENVGRARIQGMTASGNLALGPVRLRGSVDQLDPVNESSGKRLARRALQQAALGADWPVGPWQFGASLLRVGQRFDDSANTRSLPAYQTLDLSAEYRWMRDLRLQLRINNVTDARYQTAYSYQQPGRAGYLTLRWQPQ